MHRGAILIPWVLNAFLLVKGRFVFAASAKLYNFNCIRAQKEST